jgi:hypothetical protein
VIKLFASFAIRDISAKRIQFAPSLRNFKKDKFGVLEVKLREDKLKNLKSDLQRQQNIFTVTTKSVYY